MAGRRTASYRTDHGRYTGRDSQTRAWQMAGSSFYVLMEVRFPKTGELRKEEKKKDSETNRQSR